VPEYERFHVGLLGAAAPPREGRLQDGPWTPALA
jgi:hypothetical protein